MPTTKKVIGIIGSGFAGLSAASVLGAAGCETHIFEKNAMPGGRARQLYVEKTNQKKNIKHKKKYKKKKEKKDRKSVV